jgi:hypothetical protein
MATELVKATMKDEVSGLEVINFKALDKETRGVVSKLTITLQSEMQKTFQSYLNIGRILSTIQGLLKPRGLFVPYVNTLPGFSQATAYRYIAAFENASQLLPETVLKKALVGGFDIIHPSKEKPFGKYQAAVDKIGMPPKDATDEQADAWLNEVRTAQKETAKRGGKTSVTPEDRQKQCFSYVLSQYSRITPKTKQNPKWLAELFGYICNNLSLTGGMSVKPIAPPEKWTKEEKSEGRPSKSKKKGNGEKLPDVGTVSA